MNPNNRKTTAVVTIVDNRKTTGFVSASIYTDAKNFDDVEHRRNQPEKGVPLKVQELLADKYGDLSCTTVECYVDALNNKLREIDGLTI